MIEELYTFLGTDDPIGLMLFILPFLVTGLGILGLLLEYKYKQKKQRDVENKEEERKPT